MEIELLTETLFSADVLLELYSYTEEPEFFVNKKCFDEMSMAFCELIFVYHSSCSTVDC